MLLCGGGVASVCRGFAVAALVLCTVVVVVLFAVAAFVLCVIVVVVLFEVAAAVLNKKLTTSRKA
jgi:hypothetical protein